MIKLHNYRGKIADFFKKNLNDFGLMRFSLFLAIFFAAISFLALLTPVFAEGIATIWTTDLAGNPKTDFAPEETVYIQGENFDPAALVGIDVNRPDSIVDSGSATTNENGAFVFPYLLDGITGTDTVRASDGTNLATTVFTDASIDSECQEFGFDFGVAKWECEGSGSWNIDEEEYPGTLVTGNGSSCSYADWNVGSSGADGIVVKAGRTVHYAIVGTSGIVNQDAPAISHITFCGYETECGNQIIEEGEQCEPPNTLTCDADCQFKPPMSCIEVIEAGLLHGYIDLNKGFVFNESPWDYNVGLAVYEKFDEIIDNQELFDYDTGTVDANDSIMLAVDLPECKYQIDLFCGPVLFDLNGQRYGNRKLGLEHAGGSNYCMVEECGNGVVEEPEECDDGNNIGGDGCSATCTIEPFCGDGTLDDGEECDDGNNVDGDGCSSTCTIEPFCGNGTLDDGEECDDGNLIDEDGCDSNCRVEEFCPLVIHKEMVGNWFGQCPPQDLNETCYVADNNSSGLTVSVESSGQNCLPDEIDCYFELWWNEQLIDYGQFTSPLEIIFAEESLHELRIRCENAHGSLVEDTERFLVDSTPPEPEKIVGEPKEVWDGLDSIFYDLEEFCQEPENCWKVTMLTPITLSCNDPQPHPVGNEKVCFYVELDGEDATQDYCSVVQGDYNANGDNYCCLEGTTNEFYFQEETEHNLKYYCEDALGNRGSIDDEKFKVEGTVFRILLNKKWNLVSVPFMLLDSNIEIVLADIIENVESVWAYEDGNWYVFRSSSPELSSLHEMIPGYGYWISMYESDTLVLGGSLFSPIADLPSRSLERGWNLVGYYGTDGVELYNGPHGEGRMAGCALFSLGESYLDTGWTALLTYWEPYNPYQWIEFGYYDNLDPGAGYWISLQEEGVYEYTTIC